MSEDGVNMRAVGWEVLAINQIADSPAHPYNHLALDPAGFQYFWKLLQFAFELPDIYGVHPLNCALDSGDREVLQRFIYASREIAESEILNREQSFTVNFDGSGGEPVIETSFSSKEVLRGFSVLFRQFYTDDPASFTRALKITQKVNEKLQDVHHLQRREVLQQWQRAQGKLRGLNLKSYVRLRLIDQGLMAESLTFPDGRVVEWNTEGDAPSPESLISTFQYGDLIHWGSGRSTLESFFQDPMTLARRQGQFLQATAGLAHLYMGFGALLLHLFPALEND